MLRYAGQYDVCNEGGGGGGCPKCQYCKKKYYNISPLSVDSSEMTKTEQSHFTNLYFFSG